MEKFHENFIKFFEYFKKLIKTAADKEIPDILSQFQGFFKDKAQLQLATNWGINIDKHSLTEIRDYFCPNISTKSINLEVDEEESMKEFFRKIPKKFVPKFSADLSSISGFGSYSILSTTLIKTRKDTNYRKYIENNPEILIDDEFDILFSDIIYRECIQRSKLSRDAKIRITEIHIPENPYFPYGSMKNLTSCNFIIGKNNQKKTRLLNLIKHILIALSHFPTSINDLGFENDYLETLNLGIKMKLHIYFQKKSGSEICWGWEFPKFEPVKDIFELKFENNHMKIESKTSYEVMKNSSSFFKYLLIPDNFQILSDEKLLQDGEMAFFNKFNSNEISFIHGFRRLIAYYFNAADYDGMIYQKIELTKCEILDIYEQAEKWVIYCEIQSIFNFQTPYAEGSNTINEKSWNKFASDILKREKFDLTLNLDTQTNKYLLENRTYLGREIDDQGHGIKKLFLIFVASIFTKFLMIDEPENGLHINLQNEITDFLIMKPSIQTFITTHSPSMIKYDPKVSVFTIDHGIIQPRLLYSSSESDIEKILKSRKHIRNIIGATPEHLLFYKAIIFVEGKYDKLGFSNIFRKLNFNIVPVNGKDNMEKKINELKSLQEYFHVPLFFLFDRDYFNEKIYSIDDNHSFTLPCYSFENILIDPSFLGHIYDMKPEIILEKLNQIIKPRKNDTLCELILHFVLGNRIPEIIREEIKTINLTWSDINNAKIKEIFQNRIRVIIEKNLGTIQKLHKSLPNLKNSFLDLLFLTQLFNENIPFQFRKIEIDWGNFILDKILVNLSMKVSDEKIYEAISEVQKIDSNWDIEGYKFVEIKSWFESLTKELWTQVNGSGNKQPSKKSLINKFHTEFENRSINSGLIFEMRDLLNKMQ